MTEEDKSEVQSVLNRYSWLGLSTEQAQQFIAFEESLRGPSRPDYTPSFWEEQDMERIHFSSFLDKSQLSIYIRWQQKHIAYYERILMKQNAGIKLVDFRYEKERLQLITDTYTPDFYAADSLSIDSHTNTIAHLKAGYKQALQQRRREIWVDHVRYHRLFSQNILRAELLRHNHHYVVPNYALFIAYLEKPSQHTIETIIKDYSSYEGTIRQINRKKTKALQTSLLELSTKYYGDKESEQSDFSPEVDQQQLLFQFLLFDPVFYQS